VLPIEATTSGSYAIVDKDEDVDVLPMHVLPMRRTTMEYIPAAENRSSGSLSTDPKQPVAVAQQTPPPPPPPPPPSAHVDPPAEDPPPPPPPESTWAAMQCYLDKGGKAVEDKGRGCTADRVLDPYGQEWESGQPNDQESSVEWIHPDPGPELDCEGAFTVDRCMGCPKYRYNGEEYWQGDPFLFEETFGYLKRESTFVDIGGYTGETISALNELYHPHFEIFEPMDKALRILQSNLSAMTDLKFNVHPYGLGSSDRVMYMEEPSTGDSARMVSDPSARMKDGSIEKVVIKHAATAMKNVTNGASVTLLHVNCEGCEWEVLESLQSVFPQMEHIAIQWHGNSRQPNRMERWCKIREKLHETHELDMLANWVWEHWTLKGLYKGCLNGASCHY